MNAFWSPIQNVSNHVCREFDSRQPHKLFAVPPLWKESASTGTAMNSACETFGLFHQAKRISPVKLNRVNSADISSLHVGL